MYMGEHTNVTEKLHDIQKQGRTKGSLLDHIAIPVTAFFVATDLMTVHLYTESLFDERPEMAMLVAASIALLLDACPMVAGKLKGQLDDMLPRDQRATKRRISALLGTAVGAFAIFAGFCIVSTLISVEALGATENPTLYMVGQYIRMLLPIATSVGSYAIGFFSDHRSQLDSLKAQRLDLQDLAADTDSAISHAEFAAANFNPDLQDYRFACAKLKSLSVSAQQARLTARMKLAEELGISRTPMREALILLNNAHMVAIKPQSGTHVAPIDLHLMELEQFSRYTLEKEILTRMCGRLTPEQEAGYRQLIEAYRVLEASPEEPDRETRLLELDNAFHRRAFELCGMEHHFDHMLASLQHVERIRKFSLQTNENKAVCAAHTRILDAMVQNDTQELSRALESHLSRYKQTVEEVQRLHPDYFTDGLEP